MEAKLKQPELKSPSVQTGRSINQAMVLAAGLGSRMRPITDDIPKPLVSVSGNTLLDHCLDALAHVGVSQTVVNVHYLPDMIIDHVATRMQPAVIISDERDALLNSGGGIKKALPLLGANPFFLLNADSFWLDQSEAALNQMRAFWRDDVMDILLLLSPMESAIGFSGKGDFFQNDDGRLQRRAEAAAAPYAYAGVAVLKPAIFEGVSETEFSLNMQFDDAIAKGRLFGMPLDGLWLHVGTPDAIIDAEAAIEAFENKLDKGS